MVILLGIGVAWVLGGLMLTAIRRLAIRCGEPPVVWTVGLALVWGCIGVVWKAGTMILGDPASILFQRWYPWLQGGCILLSVTMFALFWSLLDTRTP